MSECDSRPVADYLSWHAEAERRDNAGERQIKCKNCQRWYFPNWPADAKRHSETKRTRKEPA